jgi:hypothetical protein
VRVRVCVLAATVCSGCFLLVSCKSELLTTFCCKPFAVSDPSRCSAMVSSCRSDVKHGSRPGGSTLVVTRHCPVEMRRSNWWVSQLSFGTSTQQQTAGKQHETHCRASPPVLLHPHTRQHAAQHL